MVWVKRCILWLTILVYEQTLFSSSGVCFTPELENKQPAHTRKGKKAWTVTSLTLATYFNSLPEETPKGNKNPTHSFILQRMTEDFFWHILKYIIFFKKNTLSPRLLAMFCYLNIFLKFFPIHLLILFPFTPFLSFQPYCMNTELPSFPLILNSDDGWKDGDGFKKKCFHMHC